VAAGSHFRAAALNERGGVTDGLTKNPASRTAGRAPDKFICLAAMNSSDYYRTVFSNQVPFDFRAIAATRFATIASSEAHA
jgi:hypothetical protein